MFAEEASVVPDLAIHEVVNALFVQEHVLHRIRDGVPYVRLMYEAIEAKLITVVGGSESLIEDSYEMASRTGSAVYDCVFVVLALSTGQELKTHDEKQKKLYDAEAARRLGSGNSKTRDPLNGN